MHEMYSWNIYDFTTFHSSSVIDNKAFFLIAHCDTVQSENWCERALYR